jgi:hypothetical protein
MSAVIKNFKTQRLNRIDINATVATFKKTQFSSYYANSNNNNNNNYNMT